MTLTTSHPTAAPANLTPDTLLTRMQTASAPALSPDGTEVVYVVSRVDTGTMTSVSHLWLMDLATGDTSQLTRTGTSNGAPAWSPDGRRIAFISNRTGAGRHVLCIIDRSGGEAAEIETFAAKPVSVTWHPEGIALAVVVPMGKTDPSAPRVITRIDYKQDNRGLINDERQQVMLVWPDRGETRQLTDEPFDHVWPQWSPDGRRIAVKQSRQNGMASQLLILDDEGDELKRIGVADGTVGTWAWSPDGGTILFDGTEVPSPQTDYYRYDVASGEVTKITDDAGFASVSGFPTISGPDQPVWRDDRKVLIHGLREGASGIWELDVQSGEYARQVWWNATHGGFSADTSGQRIVQTVSSLETNGELVLVDMVAEETRRLTHLNDALFEALPLAKNEKITVERDGWPIDAWVLKPANFDENGSYPVILDVHGGPHGNYGFSFNAGAQLMAAAGFVVVASNPRGSGTYGRVFAEAVHGDWGGEDWKDLQAVLDKVLENPWADTDRTGIYGYSYGGFMTSWAIGQTDRFKAAVCGAPVFNLRSFYGTSDIGHVWAPTQWGGDIAEIEEFLTQRSPSTWIHRATTPTLIVHGEEDHRCPIGQGEEMFVALKKAGCEVEFVRYPGGSHLMLRGAPLSHRLDYYDRVIAWFRTYLDT
ncbi:MAG TPA: S9 family peptidase [Thermomicrobiales bacterium]|nr:S9 family peptidase [Thermomicrobiales bacterium]